MNPARVRALFLELAAEFGDGRERGPRSTKQRRRPVYAPKVVGTFTEDDAREARAAAQRKGIRT